VNCVWLVVALALGQEAAHPEQQALSKARQMAQSAGYGAASTDWELRVVGPTAEPVAFLCAGTLPDQTTAVVLMSSGADRTALAHHRSPLSLPELHARLARAACRALNCDSVAPGALHYWSPLDLWQEFEALRSPDGPSVPAGSTTQPTKHTKPADVQNHCALGGLGGEHPRRVTVSLRNLAVRPSPFELRTSSFVVRPSPSTPDRTGMNWLKDVPDWDWHYGCAPTAAANVLTWWAGRGFGRLLDSIRHNVPDRLEGGFDSVPNVSAQLAAAMNTDTLKTGSTASDSIAPGIVAVCNDPAWNNGYDFSSFLAWNDHDLLVREIDAGRPGVLGLLGHPEYGNHAVTFCGWGPPDDRWIMVHDLWGGTPVDRVINFDYGGPVAVVPVVPGKSAGPDLCVAAIVQPTDTLAPGVVTPQAEVANLGTSAGTATAFFLINDGLTGSYCYSAGVEVSLEPGRRLLVEFPAWEAPVGEYLACCSLAAPGSTLSHVRRSRFSVLSARLADRGSTTVRVYPNPVRSSPTRGSAFLQVVPRPLAPSTPLRILIFDSSGRLFLQSRICNLKPQIPLDLRSLPPGCYLLRLDRAGRAPASCSFLVTR